MARFNYRGIAELDIALSDLANAPEEVIYNVLMAGAAAVIEAQKRKLEELGLVASRQLIDSIKAFKRSTNGAPSVLIYPAGGRKNGSQGKRRYKGRLNGSYEGTNSEVGYIHEYGSARHKATHWMELANEEAAEEMLTAEQAAWDEYVASLGL